MGPMFLTICLIVVLMVLTDAVLHRLGINARPPRGRRAERREQRP